MTKSPVDEARETLEVDQLVDGLYQLHGYDFREYAWGSLRRRIRERVRAERVPSITRLTEKVLADRPALERLLLGLSVNASAMFRDPTFFRAFRERVVPLLRTQPLIRVWHAGCSSGAEVYSLAILMEEEGLYDRCRFYATDMNDAVLQRAKVGIFPLKQMRQYTTNYIQAGGEAAFSEYYTASYEHAIFRPSLRANMVFAQHNLATDGRFNEFQVVMCRNVMIYFQASLQERVHELLLQSLAPLGFLALGYKESLRDAPVEERYHEFVAAERIYRRLR
jgi:chemotaxis protein methyltransferase CheR